MTLHEFLVSDYGESLALRIEEGFLRDRPATFRVNSLKADAEEARSLAAETVPWMREAFVSALPESELQKSGLYREGKIYLQSLSSMLPPLYLDPKAGENILDMTAAPGGKTCELYALSGGKAFITACERDKIRFGRLQYNLQKQGAGRVSALLCDAAALDDFLTFDKILLDAPCSGTGTVTPASPIRFSEEYLRKCVRMQEKLLKKALRLVKRGGTVVYSTCSVLKAENEGLLASVLPACGARSIPIAPFEGVPVLPSAEGTVAVCPTRLYEGFFVAKIVKE